MKVIDTISKKEDLIIVLNNNKEEYEQEYQKQAKNAALKVKVPGFRPGKAPFPTAIKYCNQEKIIENTLNKLSKIASQFISDDSEKRFEKLIIGEYKNIEIKSFDFEKKVAEFNLTFDAIPTIEISNYQKIEHNTVFEDKLSPHDLDDKINSLLNQHAKYETTDQSSTKESVINFDFEGYLNKVLIPQACAKSYELDLSNSTFIKGFAEELINLKKDETKEFDIKFPDDYHSKDLQGKMVTFKIKVNEIKSKLLPKFDDDFIKSLNNKNYKNISEYKDFTSAELLNNLKINNKKTKETLIINWALGETNKLSHYPITAISQQTANNFEDFKNNINKQFNSKSGYLDYLKYLNTSEDDMKKNMFNEIATSLKLSLVLEKISAIEKISVTPEDIKNTMEELKANNANLNLTNSILDQTALHKKTIEFLKEKLVYIKK